MKLWATLGGGDSRRELDLEVQLEHGRLVLDTAEGRVSADVAPLPDGESYSLLVDGRSYEVAVEDAPGGAARVIWKGKTFDVVVKSPLEKVLREVRHAAPAAAGAVLHAPMPGLVLAVHVTAGEAVDVGRPMLVMEAMKMQNELTAESSGVVRSVHVSPGQSVESGQALITLAPPAAEPA